MAIHICRDFFERALSTQDNGLYLLAIFLRYVMNFTVVGQTNFNLNGASITKGSGSGASINMGSPDQFAIAIPSGQYTVSVADIDRILALRSGGNSMTNSGLFRITGINTTNNWVYVNYSTGEFPPVEIGTLLWAICELETVFVFNTGGNAIAGGYRSNGAATTSRIILQSPHSSGWQVRLCRESTTDTGNGLPQNSIAPGMNGDTAGDFVPGGENLHINLWRNQSNATYFQNVVGLNRADVSGNGGGRIYIWGDDATSSIVFVMRDAGCHTTQWLMFGIPENEDPFPGRDVQRLFAIGTPFALPGSITPGVALGFKSDFFRDSSGTQQNFQMGGVGFGLSRQPISACFSSYAKLTGQPTSAGNPKFDSAAADNVFTQQTELLPVDIVVGTYDNFVNVVSDSVTQLEVRRLGTAPMARSGRVFGSYTLSIDKLWIHLLTGVWMPWSGMGNLP
jgi:hypothetical protein